jgi:hypothetical protein
METWVVRVGWWCLLIIGACQVLKFTAMAVAEAVTKVRQMWRP